jgi:protein-disulfide isomerase
MQSAAMNILVERQPRRLVVALLAAFVLAAAGCAGSPAAAPQAGAPAADAPPGSDYRTLGSPRAQVVIIEFTDLQCPFCSRFALQVFPALRERYVDKGLVRFESHDLPLHFHAYAVPAAIAARCAGEQGKFWEFRESLFRRQSELPGAPYDSIARQLGLDLPLFSACRAEPRVAQEVRADADLAAANGIDGTPSFVIGRMEGDRMPEGELVAGAQPLEFFVAKLDALLAP